MKKQLPTGVQTFQKFTDENMYYVDKTEHIFKMVSTTKYYFLSRPRRFGKTLLVETIKSLFEGKSELFKNTYIYNKWDFKQNIHPVIVFDFGKGKFKTKTKIEGFLLDQINSIEEDFNIDNGCKFTTLPGKIGNIIKKISQKNKNKGLVILIDEFDKPMIDAIDNKELAEFNKDVLAELYGTIKSSKGFLRFVFVTGITMFSKDDMSSGMNHFTDISLDPDFSTICGYTEKELSDVFSPELKGVDIKKIRDYYNGYSWDGKTSVYNPYSILYYLEKKNI